MSATEWRGDLSVRISLYNASNGDIHSRNANEETRQHGQDSQTSLKPLPPPSRKAIFDVVRVVEPEHAGNTIREPRGEQTRRDAD